MSFFKVFTNGWIDPMFMVTFVFIDDKINTEFKNICRVANEFRLYVG